MNKNKPEVKIVKGTSIAHMKGNNSWLTCTMENGEIVTISFTVLFKFFDNYNLEVREFGKGTYSHRWRTIRFIPKEE